MTTLANVAASASVKGNGIPPPSFSLPLPDDPDTITANLLLLIGQTPNPRLRFIYQNLVKHIHAFVKETSLSTEEWMAAIEFLARTGEAKQMIPLSIAFGGTALVHALNNHHVGATQGGPLGPFFTEDANDIAFGGSIQASNEDGKGTPMYVEGRILTTEGEPIADAVIYTWEADADGNYDLQYADRTGPDHRGRLRSQKDGRFGYWAIVPVPYPAWPNGPVAELFISQGRHNMRPGHIHLTVEAPGYKKLITQLFPEGCMYLTSDPVLCARTSLIVPLEDIDDENEARKRGSPNGGPFKLLKRDIVLLTEEQSESRLNQQRTIGRLEELSLQ